MINFLGIRQALIKICFALSVGPEHVPVVAIGGHQAVKLKYEFNQLTLTFQHFVKTE
jgi:hypothetical protein